MARIEDIGAFNAVREVGLAKLVPSVPRITVGMGTCGRGNGAEGVYHAFAEAIDRTGAQVVLATVGCFGSCFEEPLVSVRLPGRPLVILRRAQLNDAARVLHDLMEGNLTSDLAYCKIEEWDHITSHVKYGQGYPDLPSWNDVPFFKGQKKIVLRNCGLINPDDIEEYIAIGGYQALYKVLIDGRPEIVIEQMKAAKLRGRGGAGYLTGNKWEFLSKTVASQKYVICNADEGDPGAYMNRNEIESDPHSLIEGMIVGGYVMGATEGIIYVRAEYPLAVHRLNRAIEQAREYGMLGENILGRGFNFDISLVEGAGAFVCGEETALIASLEGESGRPRPRPPYPAQKGLWGKPTNINNVETWYNDLHPDDLFERRHYRHHGSFTPRWSRITRVRSASRTRSLRFGASTPSSKTIASRVTLSAICSANGTASSGRGWPMSPRRARSISVMRPTRRRFSRTLRFAKSEPGLARA